MLVPTLSSQKLRVKAQGHGRNGGYGENIRIDEVECGYKPLAGWTICIGFEN